MSATYDYLIVGAGLSGLVLAERLGSIGKRCLIIEKRNHIGGNCYDRVDSHGILYHAYGPHYFRTNALNVISYLSRFTDWRKVTYGVKVHARGKLWSFPINLNTYRQFIENDAATEADFIRYLAGRVIKSSGALTAKDVILESVGPEFFELFYEGYTRKQWGRDASQMDPSVSSRIPVRTIADDSYFREHFQALPANGYTAMFEKMLEASGAELRLSMDYREAMHSLKYGHLIYTGPIDAYFSYCEGILPYRTMQFQLEELRAKDVNTGFSQDTLQINYPGEEKYTRTVELKHITGQQSEWTNIVREFPGEYRLGGGDDPQYPIIGAESRMQAARYRDLAKAQPNVTFIGRLAEYRYLNMDQVVAGALHAFETML